MVHTCAVCCIDVCSVSALTWQGAARAAQRELRAELERAQVSFEREKMHLVSAVETAKAEFAEERLATRQHYDSQVRYTCR